MHCLNAHKTKTKADRRSKDMAVLLLTTHTHLPSDHGSLSLSELLQFYGLSPFGAITEDVIIHSMAEWLFSSVLSH